MTHPQDLGLREQAQAIADGSLDAGELLDATLERIAERDGALTSTPVVFADEAARDARRGAATGRCAACR